MQVEWETRIPYSSAKYKCQKGEEEGTLIIYLFLIIHLFTCAYIVWVISPPCPVSTLSPPCPSLPSRTHSVLFSSSIEE
jgi:hypothetical protein